MAIIAMRLHVQVDTCSLNSSWHCRNSVYRPVHARRPVVYSTSPLNNKALVPTAYFCSYTFVLSTPPPQKHLHPYTRYLQLSELNLQSSPLPFPAQDLPLGSEALSAARREVGEWDEVRGELGRVREEYEGLVRQLAEAERKLQVALQQRDQLEEQVRVCTPDC